MGATAGTINVELDANTVKYHQKMEKADQATRRAAQRMRRKTVAEFKKMGKQAALFSTAVAGAMAVAVRSSVQYADAIAKTADKVGVGTSALQELRFAADQAGVAQNALDMGLQRFSRRVGEAVQGQGELRQTLEQYNIQLKDAAGNTRSVEEILRDYADVIKNAESNQEQLRLAFKAFDSEGAALVNLFRGGADAVDAYAKQARELGLVVSEDLIRKSEDLANKMNVLNTVLRVSIAEAVLENAAAIESLVNSLIRLAGWFGESLSNVMRGWRDLTGTLQPQELIDKLKVQGRKLDEQVIALEAQLDRAVRGGFDSVAEFTRQKLAEVQANRIALQAEIEQLTRNTLPPPEGFSSRPGAAVIPPLVIPPVAPAGTTGTDMPAIDEEAERLDRRAADIFQQTRTEFEQYTEALNEAFFLFSEELIDEETYWRWVDQIESGFIRIEEQAEESATEMSVFWEQAARNMQDMLADFLFDPFSEGLDGMVKDFAVMMRRMIAQAAAAKIFESMGGTSGIGAALAGMFDGARASGGPVSAGRAYLVGEEGPELVVPKSAGNVIPSHMLGGQNVFQTIVQAPQGRITRESEGRARAMQQAQAVEYARRNS